MSNLLKINSFNAISGFVLLLFNLFLSTSTYGQGLEVLSPISLSMRQEAVNYERLDFNGRPCAMIVLYFFNDNVDFEGDIRSSQYRGNGEWWIWMVEGANWITIKTVSYTPLRLEFEPLQSGKTYEMKVQPAAQLPMLIVQEEFHADLSMTDAVNHSLIDSNGKTCALLRLGLVLSQVYFEGVEKFVKQNGEWWLWLSPSSRCLKIHAQGYQTLTVMLDSVMPAVTYVMTLYKVDAMSEAKTKLDEKQIAEPKTTNLTFTVRNVSFSMVHVTGGSYNMGAQSKNKSALNYDPKAWIEERPVHKVSVKSFYIGQMEVTQELWMVVMQDNPSKRRGPNLPVENVSYDDIMVFISRLNQLTGHTFRLPTEEEWEYVARGGNRARNSKSIGQVAWYSENSGKVSHPVGGKQANELGVFDILGNVREWCGSCWSGDYNEKRMCSSYVVRGGSYEHAAGGCRVSFRRGYSRDSRFANLGFRIALSN